MGCPADNDESIPSLSELAGMLSESEADTVRAAIAASHQLHDEQLGRDDIAESVRTILRGESVDREPPAPQLDGPLPSAEKCYEGEIPEWTPDEGTGPTR